MQNYSFDVQFQAGRGTLLELGYAGHQGRKLSFGTGFDDNQLDASNLALGAALDRTVPNPFRGHILTGVLAGATVPQHRLMRPFPQFTTVSRTGFTPGGSSSYNALMATFTQRFSAGLTLLSSYQWSKGIDNIAETEPALGGAADVFRTISRGRFHPATS